MKHEPTGSVYDQANFVDPYRECEAVRGASRFIPEAWTRIGEHHFDENSLELAVAAHYQAAGCYVFHHDGTLAAGWPRLVQTWTYCPPTIADLDEKVELFGPPSSKRSYMFILQGHAHEHLGQAIAYARSVGVAPPWSLPAPEAADEAAEEGKKEGSH